MSTDKEYLQRHGLREDDRVVNEYEDRVDGAPPKFIGTKIVRASGEIVAWPLNDKQK